MLLTLVFRFPGSQTSQPVSLVQGKVYYMEGLLKEGGGGDHLSVAVRLPSGPEEKPLVNNLYITPPGGKYMDCILFLNPFPPRPSPKPPPFVILLCLTPDYFLLVK